MASAGDSASIEVIVGTYTARGVVVGTSGAICSAVGSSGTVDCSVVAARVSGSYKAVVWGFYAVGGVVYSTGAGPGLTYFE